MKRERRTRDDALKAEDQAVRLSARGLTDREIGVALGLSESEARRKRQLGLARRRESLAADGVDAVAQTGAEVDEAVRTAYRDHDESAPGSPARVGFLKVIVDLMARRARLRGVDLERLGVAVLPVESPGQATEAAAADLRGMLRDADESLREGARSVIELALATAPGDVRLPLDQLDAEGDEVK